MSPQDRMSTTAPSSTQEAPAVAPIIRVDDLVKRYKGATSNAVDGVSFEVRPGELFALLGPNGAGKTTTISILTTTLLPSSGRALIAGADVAKEPARVRRRVGIIFQNPSLDLNLTAEENVRFHAVLYGVYPLRPSFRLMPAAYRARVEELAEVVGLGEEIFAPIRTFSGGMRRKLEIVRSLVHSPEVLFLDEPTTGLDPSSRRALWRYLEGIRKDSGTTLFLTTHYLEEAEQADRICILGRGRVVALGTPADVKADLVQDYVLLTAEGDPTALRTELSLRGFAAQELEDGRFRLAVSAREVHPALRAIETPLRRVVTHTPSLEDAYLEIVERPADEAALAEEEARIWADAAPARDARESETETEG